jgi:hypothetical protein
MAGPIALGLGIGTSYYQHSASTISPLEFQSRSLEPLIRFDRDTERSRILLEARRKFDLYSGPGLGQTFGGTRQIADHAALHLRQTWSERDRLLVDGSFLRSRDVLDVDQRTLALQSEVAEWGGNAVASLGRVEGAFRARGWSYDAPDLHDALARSWTIRVLPVMRAESAWFLGWHERELVTASQTAVRSHVAATGFRRQLWPGVSAEAEAGASEVAYADGGRRSGPEAAFGLESSTGGPNALSARLQVERAFPATLTARASHRVGDGWIWLSGESLVDAEGGFYRYPTFTRRVGVGLQDTLARATVIGFEASRGSLRPFHTDETRAEIVQASAWIARRVRPWLTGHAGCSYLKQSGDDPSGTLSFRRVRVDAALTALSP